RISNASTAPIGRRSSTRISSSPSRNCERSPTPGCGSTTTSGPMTASAGCRRLRFFRGPQQPANLSLQCLLDGEAYEPTLLDGQAVIDKPCSIDALCAAVEALLADPPP